MRRAIAPVLAALALSACTPAAQTRAPEPVATRAATDILRDTLIASSLRARLVSQYPDAAAAVRVSVSGGVVTLRGAVPDAKTRERMVQDAEMTVQVQSVVDLLRVDPRARQPRGSHRRNGADRAGVAGP